MAFVKYQKTEDSPEPVKASTIAKTGKKLACKCGGNCTCKKSECKCGGSCSKDS